ncbi:Type I transmembrane sorting receptor [Podila horticola]|nr:Type I transmembrane sorting receptor [Podila horticola]
MKSLLSISLTLAALTLITASPVNSKRSSKNQGPIAIPLKRYNIGAPDAKSGFKELAVNPVPLNNQTDLVNNQIVLFSVTVSIGTPAVDYQLVVDTGSEDTWVVSADCTSVACLGRTPFYPGNSSSIQEEFWKFAYTFSDINTVTGDIYTDVVTVSNTAVEDQSFGVATSLLTPDSTIPGDGILGLPATDYNNPSFFESFFDNAFQYGSLTQYIFSLYMPKNGSGELLLGGLNATQFTGDLTYLPVGSKTLWQVSLTDVAYHNRSLKISLMATIATASSLIQLDRQSIITLYDAIPGANRLSPTRWSVPCNQISSFTMTMGGVKFQIPGTSISLGPVSVGSTQCLSAIAGGAMKGHATLGMAFLQNYYMVFDKSTIPFRVGLATIA